MNKKEIGELRRRLTPDRNNISYIRGCYVNEKHEIISTFKTSFAALLPEESEKFLTLLKKVLSGSVGRNLIDISFATNQVADSEEHRALSALRNSSLCDEKAVEDFYAKVIASLEGDGNNLILLAHNTYDVPVKQQDGEALEDSSTDVFSHIICCVCPVKLSKPALSYFAEEKEFHNRENDWIVSAPETGFMFPAFDDRKANIYGALFYTHDTKESNQAFADAVFKSTLPMPAEAQAEMFADVLAESLKDECSYEVVQTVRDEICTMIEQHEQDKDDETPLVVGREDIKTVLKTCGVADDKLEDFGVKFDGSFGENAALNPQNIVNSKKFELKTPDVVIKVNPERSDLIDVKTVAGIRYVMVRVQDGVEVNGVNIRINETAEEKA